MLNKLKSYQGNIQEIIITALGQFLYLFQSLIQNKIFASYFETAVFGQWALISSAYVFISMLPFTALEQGINKEAMEVRKNGYDKQFYSLITFLYASFFSIYVVVLFFLNYVQKEDFFANGYLSLFILYTFTEITKNTYLVLDNAYRNRKRVFYIRLVDLISRVLLYILLFHLDLFSIKTVLLVLCLTNVLILFLQRDYFREINFQIDKTVGKPLFEKIIKFSSPLIIWAVFGWMQNMIGRWYLDMFLDLEAVAAYTILTSLSPTWYIRFVMLTSCRWCLQAETN